MREPLLWDDLSLSTNGFASHAHPRPLQRLRPALEKARPGARRRVVTPRVNVATTSRTAPATAAVVAKRKAKSLILR